MRNSGIIISLLFGYLMAGVIPREGKHYVSTQTIQESDVITFLWWVALPLCVAASFSRRVPSQQDLSHFLLCLQGQDLSDWYILASGAAIRHQLCCHCN